MRYQLRDKEPDTLNKAQEMAIKMDLNMQASRKSNIPGFTRAFVPPKPHEPKAKDPSQEVYDRKIKKLNEKIETMQNDYVDQLKNMQNRMIIMERSYNRQKNLPPKNNNWVPKKAPQDRRPPITNWNQLIW